MNINTARIKSSQEVAELPPVNCTRSSESEAGASMPRPIGPVAVISTAYADLCGWSIVACAQGL